jgi:aldehyde oxidoreductase
MNGIKKEVVCSEDRILLDVIRKDLGLTGIKRGCDNEGYCGACSIILDGEVVRSCLIPMRNVPDDTKIITIEGIGTLNNPHPIQKAFAYEGAIQCGFCTPGMIIVAKALLDKNPNPTEEEIRHAFKANLCRCTGYSSIIRAVHLAGKLLTGEVKEEEIRIDTSKGTFGKRVPRPNSLEKSTGATQFGDDIPMPPGTLHLKIVRSPHHHAIIKSIDSFDAEQMPGVVGVLTSKDIPGTNRLKSAQTEHYKASVPSESILCDNKANEWGSAIAIVAAETVEQASDAAGKVKIEYEVLPRYRTPIESLGKGAIPIIPEYDSNHTFTGYLKKGIRAQEEAEKAMEDSDVVVNHSFVTSRQPHLFNEPDNALAFIDENGRITVMSKTTSVHGPIRELSNAIGVSPDKLRFIENPSGGLFGYKGSITCEGFVVLAAMKFRRPCKIVYTMAESILTTGKRSRIWINAKIGAARDGHIKCLIYDFDQDCGAYDSHGSILVNKCHNYIGGPHNIPKVYGEGRVVLTNNNRGTTCCRGLGATQSQLVSEVLIDMLAEKLGVDPLEFRYRNAWREGDVSNWGARLDCYPYPAMLERLRPIYQAAKEKARIESNNEKKRGVGIGAAFFGCGIDDIPDRSVAWVELNPDNGVTVYATWADSGQGGDIGILTIASKAMGGLPPEKIRMVTNDSSMTPNSGPSVASRQTSITGNAIRLACESLVRTMKDNNCKSYNDMIAKGVPLRYEGTHVCKNIVPCDENCQGNPVENWSYNLQMAEVEVEITTGRVNVLKMTTVLDAGVIHNPIAVEGQCEGGSNMGVGFGLWEDFEPGKTNTLTKGGIPNFINSPPIECLYNETFRANGTFGGTGCGEVVMMGAAPSIVNAIYDACGARISEFPAKPEKVLAALKKT